MRLNVLVNNGTASYRLLYNVTSKYLNYLIDSQFFGVWKHNLPSRLN